MPNSPVAPGTNFVFFGDSLSDNGNLEDAAQGVLPQAVLDQINGFDGRASNGLTFVEYISALLGLPEGLNYAIAGGEASGSQTLEEFIADFGLTDEIIVPQDDPRLDFDMNLGAQVDRFVSDAGTADLSSVSAFILVGGNDYLELRNADNLLVAALALFETLSSATDKTIEAASDLIQSGVGEVVISSLPTAAFFPSIASLGGSTVEIVNILIDIHNQNLANGVAALADSGANVRLLDMESVTGAYVEDPSMFGFFAPPSLTLIEGDPTEVAQFDPDQIAFWDSIHPSAALHEMLGAYTAFALENTVVSLSSGNDARILSDDGDLAFGFAGDDQVTGGLGDDILLMGSGDDIAIGGGGDDIVAGGSGADSLEGGDGADILAGGRGNDTVLGGAGEDILIDGLGADSVDGGAGKDIFIFIDDALKGTTDDGLTDTIQGGDGDDALVLVLDQATVDQLIADNNTTESTAFAALGLDVTGIEQIEVLIGLDELDALSNLEWYTQADLWGLL